MSETTQTRVNREELARRLVAAGAVDTKVAGMVLVDTFFGIVRAAVVNNEIVAIPDFGRISKYERKNGKQKVKFSAFKNFTDAVNN